MGAGCSACTDAQVPQSIEENIFDILERDKNAPDDLFKPLDVHFARNNTLTNLLALYPSRRLPIGVVSSIWRHYFDSFLECPALPTASPHVMSFSQSTSRIDAPLVAAALAGSSDSGTGSARRNGSFVASSSRSGMSGGALAAAPDVATENELQCMMWLVTDVLRHDLACLKERYDEVLAASLSMPSEGGGSGGGSSGVGVGFAFNPAPVLKAIRQDLQRLDNMPIDYLARLLVREMKGVGEDDELSTVTPRVATRLCIVPPAAADCEASATLAPPQLNAVPDANNAGVASSTSSSSSASTVLLPASPNPLDKPVTLTPRTDLPAPPSARQGPLPPLSLDLFAAHIDFSLKNLFDRYYRKGFWVLFSLNLQHHSRKVVSKYTGSGAGAGGGTWGDRISAAREEQMAMATTIRKQKNSISAGYAGGTPAGSAGGGSNPTSPVFQPRTAASAAAERSVPPSPVSTSGSPSAHSAAAAAAAPAPGVLSFPSFPSPPDRLASIAEPPVGSAHSSPLSPALRVDSDTSDADALPPIPAAHPFAQSAAASFGGTRVMSFAQTSVFAPVSPTSASAAHALLSKALPPLQPHKLPPLSPGVTGAIVTASSDSNSAAPSSSVAASAATKLAPLPAGKAGQRPMLQT